MLSKNKKSNIVVRRISSETTVTKINHYIHNNEGHELYLLLRGNVSFNIDKSIYKLDEEDLLIISNKETHRTIVDPSKTYERIYIYFSNDYLSEFEYLGYNLIHLFNNRNAGIGNKIPAKLVKKHNLSQYFYELYNWYQSDKGEKYIMMLSILLELIVKLNEIYEEKIEDELVPKVNETYNETVYEIIKYISVNLGSKITLGDIENTFFLDRYYICRLFKSVTGFTVLDYINQKKMQSAKEQLRSGKYISEVWMQYGFLNYSSFYRTFKKIVGISPLEYIEKEQKSG